MFFMNKIKEMYFKHKEGILYLFFGGVTTVTNWGSYGILVRYFNVNYNVSNIIAWVLAVAVAFVTNKIWVFESKTTDSKSMVKEITSFVGARIATGFFEVAALPVVVSMGMDKSFWGVENFIAKMLISIIVVILNYFLSKFLIFGRK